MTTTTISSVGVGKTYTTLAAWVAARAADLVATDRIEIAEIYGGGSVGELVMTSGQGWHMDATHYVIVRAATGESHGGKFTTAKAYITSTTNYPIQIQNGLSFITIGPGICLEDNDTTHPGDVIHCIGGAHRIVLDSLIIHTDADDDAIHFEAANDAVANEVKNCVVRNTTPGGGGSPSNGIETVFGANDNLKVYNCTIINEVSGAGADCLTSGGTGTLTSQNNYLAPVGGGGGLAYDQVAGTLVKGANDATSNTEATTPALRSIAFSNANFVQTTLGTEDLHLTVTSALRTKGADLSAATPSAVTNDFEGDNRVGLFYDIGADQQSDVPVCWNYTAKYRNSNKLFKASGCGSFPKTLRVPGNVDPSTGRMIDDGQLISPDQYDVV